MTTQPSSGELEEQIRLSQQAETSRTKSQEVGFEEDFEFLKIDSRTNRNQNNYQSEYEIITKPSRFFKVGRVFKVLWTEPAGNASNRLENGSNYASSSRFAEDAFTKVRYFVVVREKQDCSLCLALNTHNRQGATKNGVRSTDYAVVYAQGSQPLTAPGESLTKESFPIVVENSLKIDPMSRLNFSRVYTVEHNVKVSKVGRIPQEYIPLLEEYFLDSILGSSHPARERKGVLEPTNYLPESSFLPYTPPSTFSGPMYEMGNTFADDSSPRNRLVTGTPGTEERLDSAYRIRNHDWKRFFRCGRVFSTLWTDTLGANSTDSNQFESHVSMVAYGERVHSKIRRFVVVRMAERCCTCLPVTTYNGKGFQKRGINLEEHGLIYTSSEPPKSITGMNKEPLKIRLSRSVEKFPNPTLINYGRPYTVETNVKVKDVGELDSTSRKLLRNYYNDVNFIGSDDDRRNYSSKPPPPTDQSQASRLQYQSASYSNTPGHDYASGVGYGSQPSYTGGSGNIYPSGGYESPSSITAAPFLPSTESGPGAGTCSQGNPSSTPIEQAVMASSDWYTSSSGYAPATAYAGSSNQTHPASASTPLPHATSFTASGTHFPQALPNSPHNHTVVYTGDSSQAQPYTGSSAYPPSTSRPASGPYFSEAFPTSQHNNTIVYTGNSTQAQPYDSSLAYTSSTSRSASGSYYPALYPSASIGDQHYEIRPPAMDPVYDSDLELQLPTVEEVKRELDQRRHHRRSSSRTGTKGKGRAGSGRNTPRRDRSRTRHVYAE